MTQNMVTRSLKMREKVAKKGLLKSKQRAKLERLCFKRYRGLRLILAEYMRRWRGTTQGETCSSKLRLLKAISTAESRLEELKECLETRGLSAYNSASHGPHGDSLHFELALAPSDEFKVRGSNPRRWSRLRAT